MFFEFFQLHYEKFQTQKIRSGTINIQVLSDPKTIFSYLFSLFNILFPSYHLKVSSKLTEIEFRIVVTLEGGHWIEEHKRTLTLEMFYILVCMALTHVESHWAVHLRFVHFIICKFYFKRGAGGGLQASWQFTPKYLSMHFLRIKTFSYIKISLLSHLRKLIIP